MDPLSSATELAAEIAARRASPSEVMEMTLDTIEERNSDVGAIVTLTADAALARAAEATRHWPAVPPSLFGVPITVKDTIEVEGVRSTAGSRLLAEHVPSKSAPAVAALLQAGAILVGKTNCPEFGIGNLDTSNELFGQTRNPWDLTRSAGGSSGGDSAAVAAGMSAVGVGTDYGGSVRTPAHCTGVAALRPTLGRVDGGGVLPITSAEIGIEQRPWSVQAELQTVGFIARSVADLQRVAGVLAVAAPSAPPRRCAWFVDDGNVVVHPVVAAAVQDCAGVLADAGLDVVHRRPPLFELAHPLLAELRSAEGQPEIEKLSRGRRDQLTALVRTELEQAAVRPRSSLATDIDRVRRSVQAFLNEWPLLLMPVDIEPAFAIDEPLRPRGDVEAFCRAVTLLRLPAAVVACGTAPNGMPIGVQIAGRPHRDGEVLAAAALIEAAFGRWRPSPKG